MFFLGPLSTYPAQLSLMSIEAIYGMECYDADIGHTQTTVLLLNFRGKTLHQSHTAIVP